MSEANKRQWGGDHYLKYGELQPWDVIALLHFDFFQGNILKYLARWRDKNGIDDLEKCAHYLQKYIELVKAGIVVQNSKTKGK